MHLILFVGMMVSVMFSSDTLRTDTLHLRDAIQFAESYFEKKKELAETD